MGIPVSDYSGSGATDRLREVIEQFNAEASKQTAQIVVLTWVLVGLTAAVLIGLIVQIVLAT